MRHCVASYAGEVNKDQCGIFHLTYADKGYTVEFRITRGKYNVFQIQSKANRGAPKEVWDYIKGLIKDIKVPQPIQTKKKRGKG